MIDDGVDNAASLEEIAYHERCGSEFYSMLSRFTSISPDTQTWLSDSVTCSALIIPKTSSIHISQLR